MYAYLEEELETRFNLIKPWQNQSSSITEFWKIHQITITLCRVNLVQSHTATCHNLQVGQCKIHTTKCKEKGIRVTGTLDVLTDDVADTAIGLVLGVLKRVCAGDGFVRSAKWKDGDFGLATKFSEKSVGIVGLGRIGAAIARRAEAFGCSISYHSRSQKPFKNYKYHPDIISLAKNCHVLIVSCSLTEETRHIFYRTVIDALGPKGVLINIGRGAHVDQSELVSALLEGRLAGAGLDVFENKPEVPEELFQLDNVVLLPHVGSDTTETGKAMADLVIANLEAHFSNKPLLTPVI